MYEETIEYNGREYLVSQDIHSEDPREWWSDVEIATVRGGYGSYSVDEGNSALFQVYDTLYQGALPYLDGAYGYGEVTDYSSPRDDYDTDEEFEANASDSEKLAVKLFDEFYDIAYEEVTDMVDFVNKLNGAFGFDPGEKLQYAMIRGYSQGDWGEFIVAGPSSTDFTTYLDEFEMWINGDVYVVQDVETGDAVGGIYASESETAVKYYADDHR